MRVLIALCAVGLVLGGRSAPARAEEQSLRLMHETTSYTDVIDAFDKDDPFDLNAHLAYQRTSDAGTIKRERTSASGERSRTSVADAEHVTSTLGFGLDVGLYHDLMAFVRMPLILSDTRTLKAAGGKQGKAALDDPTYTLDASGQPATSALFSLPFDSPTRAGFDYIAIGAAWAVLNQQRHPWLPTWVLLIEGRRAIGEPLKPCREEKGETVCGQLSNGDIDGDGTRDGTNEEFGGKKAGSSRGVSAFSIETRLSRRYRYAEPYLGLGLLVEWASTSKKYFNPAGNVEGVINTLPPRQANAVLGAAIIPWENRARFQRFALDLRLQSTYYSEGHDYTALYDALGTSSHPELARPNFEGVQGALTPTSLHPCAGPSDTNCYNGGKVPFYGLTDVQAHLKYGLRLGLEMQAAQFVRFAFGTALSWVTAHALTAADSCNPALDDRRRNEGYRGSKCNPGIVNPNHHPTIDLPGRRFWMTGEFVVDVYATATAQF